ncbi:MAG: hypothetical protein ACOCWQ_03830 [Nanoarchaeota archaeon]
MHGSSFPEAAWLGAQIGAGVDSAQYFGRIVPASRRAFCAVKNGVSRVCRAPIEERKWYDSGLKG